jgi:3'-phosphoadenosine 5'-phosphosulfate sulfotransferase (PAPS reductase)/FAD synthetase
MEQAALFEEFEVAHGGSDPLESEFDPQSFDVYVVGFSGGKDCQAAFLHLLDIGIPREKIELWHHLVDGKEGSTLMDWPVTSSYCRAFAKSFGVVYYESWKVGGFEGEMLRENALTAPTKFETPNGIMETGGMRGKFSTRLKFPQVSADLTTRWCSSYLKISPCATAISGQSRFDKKRVLLVTGERAEESTARAKYKSIEEHRASSLSRMVRQWRPVHKWTEQNVWDIIRRYRVNPHPAYRLGWSRLSCMKCIFGSPNQWASAMAIDPVGVEKITMYERRFGITIRRDGPLESAIAKGRPYDMAPEVVNLAMSDNFHEPIFIDDWKLPLGAFGESAGPN